MARAQQFLYLSQQRGVSLLEICVVILLTSILSFRVMVDLDRYAGAQEKIAVEWTLQSLHATLRGKILVLRMQGRMDQAAALKSENPIEWLDKKPNNYLGEVATEELAKLPVGNWVWDKSDRALVYLLNNRKSFAAGQSNMLKFKVKSVRLPPETAKQDPRSAEQAGLLLVQM